LDDSKERDGARRIQVELKEHGHKHDIASSVERQGLLPKQDVSLKLRQTANIRYL
jgi:hypothetical protein